MQTKRKSTNFLKLGVLLFGVLLLWNCEKGDEQIILQDSLSEILQSEFNSEKFKETLPYKYEVDWSNPKKQFSEQLETSFYEFPIVYTDAFNPKTFNKQRKRGFYEKYKIVVTEKQDGKFDFFIARYYLKNNGENPDVENTIVGINLNSGYDGTVHLYDKEGKMVFAKHVNRKDKTEDFFLENKSDSLDDKGKPLAKWIRVCETITIYHYIDWYWVVSDRYGRVISSTFLYTTFEGTTQREECHQEWLPDNNNNNDYIECTEDGCVDVYEPSPIFCREGYIPDENGNCIRIPGPIEEEPEFEETITVDGPKNPIANITEFLKCFDTNSPASMTVYIDEPKAGSGKTYLGTSVGHTFISISQGNNISTFGFYPESDWAVFSMNTSIDSEMGDDGSENFSTSISTNITASQLQLIINESINYRSSAYNLSTYNCTDFAMYLGNLGGISFPSAEGTWPGGGGSNPGTLGKNIRGLSSSGNITIDKYGGTAPSTYKNCK